MTIFKNKRKRTKGLSINRMIPNFLTMIALSAGLTSVKFCLAGEWKSACVAIAVAAIFDTLDGRIARLLKGTSKFGAELDSLSDFVCFGVAPSLMLYLWTMQTAGGIGWVMALLFTISCALRLARFNTSLEEENKPSWSYNFFTGVPSPAGAGLVLLPMVLSFLFDFAFLSHPMFVGINILVVSFLLVSQIPTYSFKQFKIPHKYVLPTMLGVGLFVALSVTQPWATLSIILSAYLISVPFAIRSYAKLKRKTAEIQGDVVNLEEAKPAEDTDKPA
ncbi:MAG: CDP-diacylglycerol--serine O-phosphatidyltransferase [Alphaproteobacteria bacterium]|nr:CDP-diacylglycerol--serine O-phosphatidyltransferase [Rhodospirillales bacterium]MCW9045831.1 CDP-diacylglycerol--serine O-phosphatidyltransferase [Alphaproteobacteria bacterium]